MKNRIRRVACALPFIAIFAEPTVSSQSGEAKIDCSQGQSRRGQYELTVCSQRAAAAANEKLQGLLVELDAKLGPQVREELHQIQARWRELRDRDCHWEEGFFEGGSMAPMVRADCVTALTKARIDRLKEFLCEGATMTAPCDASRRY